MIGRAHPDRLDAIRLKTALRASPAEDEIARRLQERTGGRWLCWFGHATGRYWALRKPPGKHRLIEGVTAEDLSTAMREVDAFYGSQP